MIASIRSSSKVALVTGAAHGIGQAVGRRLLRDGFTVAFADQNIPLLKKTVLEFHSPDHAFALPMNVAEERQVRRGIAQAIKKFGRLDVLVNNAGIAQPVSKLDVRRWHAILGVNLTGSFLCAKYAIPHLRKTKGSIINMASTRALMSEPDTEAYAASKGGLVALTHSLAVTLGPAVRVNCISPGWIQTDPKTKLRPVDHQQHPVGRVGQPDDVAALVSYLVSADAGFVTGQNFIIDGGMTRKMIYAE
jgi:NAD(P)-dependent dehydrogenase (short-subunit alcohol dehydrogenase family)